MKKVKKKTTIKPNIIITNSYRIVDVSEENAKKKKN